MIDEQEANRMEDAMQKRLQRVCRAGPQWRRQSVKEILANVPFLRNIHPKVLHWIRSHSRIKVYGQVRLLCVRRSRRGVGERGGGCTSSTPRAPSAHNNVRRASASGSTGRATRRRRACSSSSAAWCGS